RSFLPGGGHVARRAAGTGRVGGGPGRARRSPEDRGGGAGPRRAERDAGPGEPDPRTPVPAFRAAAAGGFSEPRPSYGFTAHDQRTLYAQSIIPLIPAKAGTQIQ